MAVSANAVAKQVATIAASCACSQRPYARQYARSGGQQYAVSALPAEDAPQSAASTQRAPPRWRQRAQTRQCTNDAGTIAPAHAATGIHPPPPAGNDPALHPGPVSAAIPAGAQAQTRAWIHGRAINASLVRVECHIHVPIGVKMPLLCHTPQRHQERHKQRRIRRHGHPAPPSVCRARACRDERECWARPRMRTLHENQAPIVLHCRRILNQHAAMEKGILAESEGQRRASLAATHVIAHNGRAKSHRSTNLCAQDPAIPPARRPIEALHHHLIAHAERPERRHRARQLASKAPCRSKAYKQ